jgi:EmrB/QacA subfamily drug resistance transporter
MSASGLAAANVALEPKRWRALAVILIASFMVLLDTSIVTNALATIQKDLGATYAEVQFVLTAYSVAYGMVLITGGRLGDLYGRKRLFLIGLVGFTLTSVLCGFAWTPLTLIVFRVLQGLTAGLMFPQVSSIIQVLFPVNERPRAFGLQGATIGLGVVAGPLLGGLLIGANLGGSLWRPIFLVNIPIGLLALVLAIRSVPESTSEQARGLDPIGVFLVSAGMFLLTYPIIQGREAGWPAWILALLVSSLPLLVGFVLYQRNRTARGKSVLMEPSLFADRSFAVGSIITFVFQSGVLSYFLAMALFLQAGMGFTPVGAALALVSYQITTAFASVLSARLSLRLGRNILLLGAVLLAIGVISSLLILGAVGKDFKGYELIPSLILGGFGFGCVVAPLQSIILAGVNPQFAGSASGVLSTIQQVGSAVGVAIIGVIFFGQLAAWANDASAKALPKLERLLEAIDLPANAIEGVSARFQTCFRERSGQSDPSLIPESCQSTRRLPAGMNQAVGVAIADAAGEARKQNFLRALQVSLSYQLLVYTLVFGLVFVLPTTSRGKPKTLELSLPNKEPN